MKTKWFQLKTARWFEHAIKMSKKKRECHSVVVDESLQWLYQAWVVEGDGLWVEVEDDEGRRTEIAHYLRRAKDKVEFACLLFWLPFVVWGCEKRSILDLQFFAGEHGMIGFVGSVGLRRRTIEFHTMGGNPKVKISLDVSGKEVEKFGSAV